MISCIISLCYFQRITPTPTPTPNQTNQMPSYEQEIQDNNEEKPTEETFEQSFYFCQAQSQDEWHNINIVSRKYF